VTVESEMEIKDVTIQKGVPGGAANTASKEIDSKQRSGQTLSAEKLSLSARSDSVSVEIKSKQSSAAPKGDKSQRQELNSVVSTLNQIEEKTGSIEKLTESLYGVLEQASGEIPENRRAALTDEARELTEQLRVERDTAPRVKADPPVKDETLAGIEARVGRALDAIFANTEEPKPPAKSPKDAIIQTLTKVETFRSQLKQVESTLAASKQEISELVSSREDVARANTEAARSSVRDVAQAAEMMERVSQEIGSSSPSAAIVNKLDSSSLRLLSDTPEQ